MDVGTVPADEVDGVVAAVGAAEIALGMVFAGPCHQLCPADGALCVVPSGHTGWPSLGAHEAEDGGEWWLGR